MAKSLAYDPELTNVTTHSYLGNFLRSLCVAVMSSSYKNLELVNNFLFWAFILMM
jgi:hypothetical protein